MKPVHSSPFDGLSPTESLDDEGFELFVDEGERALLDVERRPDDPDRRSPEHLGDAESVAAMRLAIAELVDAYPGIGQDLNALADRSHAFGVAAAAGELETRPQLVQLVRLSLELFFQRHPTPEDYERADAEMEPDPHELRTAAEFYRASQDLLRRLRAWTS